MFQMKGLDLNVVYIYVVNQYFSVKIVSIFGIKLVVINVKDKLIPCVLSFKISTFFA